VIVPWGRHACGYSDLFKRQAVRRKTIDDTYTPGHERLTESPPPRFQKSATLVQGPEAHKLR
jgi:hypothetical protein